MYRFYIIIIYYSILSLSLSYRNRFTNRISRPITQLNIFFDNLNKNKITIGVENRSHLRLKDKAKPLVIGIAGGTASGKTTISQAIYKEIGEENITYITHDCYYHDLSHLPMSQRELANFDHPSSLDTQLLIDHIKLLKDHRPVRIPTYDYSTHSRLPGLQDAKPSPIILIEGILIFSDPNLCELMDIKIFVDTEDDIRLARRIQRDTIERGRSIEGVLNQYLTTVRPMHEQFVVPSKKNADMIVLSGLNNVALDIIVSKLKLLINR